MKPIAAMARGVSAGGPLSPTFVKQIRNRHQLSQTALALMLGVGLNTVYLWEKGITQPRAGARAKIRELSKSGGAEMQKRLRKIGLKEGMKKPGRKPGSKSKAGRAKNRRK
jgi:DNA-binding XRE family transcriptional regulator